MWSDLLLLNVTTERNMNDVICGISNHPVQRVLTKSIAVYDRAQVPRSRWQETYCLTRLREP